MGVTLRTFTIVSSAIHRARGGEVILYLTPNVSDANNIARTFGFSGLSMEFPSGGSVTLRPLNGNGICQ